MQIDTPFNIDHFEAILHDHPNQPFVKSVIRGLREGFWPFEDGDWDADELEVSQNFATKALDLDAI